MITKDKILEIAKKKGKIKTSELSKEFSISRQYLNRLIQELIKNEQLIKIGEARSTFYILPEDLEKTIDKFRKTYKNEKLEEHIILNEIETLYPKLKNIPENLKSIFTYSFSEMLNNAIEHSNSKKINIEVFINKEILSFNIEDFGIGIWNNVMQKRKLNSETEAIQDILKGKTTTMPKSHSGEGIFFTSKISDKFTLNSFGYKLLIDNNIDDIFIENIKDIKKGTLLNFEISMKSQTHLNDIFNQYSNLDEDSDYGFDKTEIRIKLYTMAGIHISRSQARRVLSGLEKFKIILFDFNKVPTVGQAFADEIFRVFQNKYPNIKLETENMNEGVEFMVKRAINESKKQ
jgi:hypothetical protein